MATITVTAFTHTEAGAVAGRALRYINSVAITDVSGTQGAWTVEFDDGAMTAAELDKVTGANHRNPRDPFEWGRLCARIDAAMSDPKLRPVGIDFIAFCRDARRDAERDSQMDAATYIQHCIDDLESDL